MSEAIEYQVVEAVLHRKNLDWWRENGVTADSFYVCREAWEYIEESFKKYGGAPDPVLFLETFSSFGVLDEGLVGTDKELLARLREYNLFQNLLKEMRAVEELAETDVESAILRLKRSGDIVASGVETSYGAHDLIKGASERKERYEERRNRDGLLGISTGIGVLDGLLGGWLPEDLVVIAGRTAEGKTWLLLYFLVQAWRQGKRVLMYSGEMSGELIGYRFDALNEHFKNKALFLGEVGEEYLEYLDKLEKNDTPFICVTQSDLGGQRMTVSHLQALIDKHKPDIVGIDQLSLMKDNRSGPKEPLRIALTNLAEDLFLMSETNRLPILTLAQINRQALKGQADETEPPEVHHIAEADGIAQNASRIITMKKTGELMKLAVRKNRHGGGDGMVLLRWDIDEGIVEPLASSDIEQLDTGRVEKVANGYGGGEELF